MTRPLLSTLQVSDVMTRDVVTIDKDERVEQALHLMEKHRISKIPVTEGGLYVGLVTDGEIADELGAIKNAGKPASALHVSGVTRKDGPTATSETPIAKLIEVARQGSVGMVPVLDGRKIAGVVTKADLLPLVTSERPLSEVMVARLHAVAPSDRVVHARRVMVDHAIERLPVLDRGTLVGMIGELDIALGLAKFKQRIPEHHQAAQLKEFLVENIMVRNVISGTPTMTIAQAAKTMHDRHVGGLPLTADGTGRIAGMVTRTDLLRTIQIPPGT